MKIATWNVNSIAARLPRVLEFLQTHRPDVVCLQETRVEPEAFPHEACRELGYLAADHSTGGRSGVAILHRREIGALDVVRGLGGAPLPEEGRWIEATLGGLRVVSVYVINGRTLDDPMYALKLRFLEAMALRVGVLSRQPLVIGGDFNIAPTDADVYDPLAFVGATHVSEAERVRLRVICEAGVTDAFRHLAPDRVEHTWWDYRGGHFHRGMGLRIDLWLASSSVLPRVRSCGIDRSFRKGQKPSDHAPLLLDLDEGMPAA
jgi:exodeoxyribonuclease-3